MELESDEADPTLEAIEFLARSKNRVAVLDVLSDGPMERYDIEDATGISRPTLSRILDDFESRGWVVASGRRYELTHLGAYVSREFTDFFGRMKVDGALGDIVEWLPDREFDFDLACLANAEVVRPAMTDALAPTTHIVRRMEAADHVRVMTYTVLPNAFDACWRETVEGDQSVEVVFDPETVATLAADERSLERAREMLETGRASFYVAEDSVPYVLIIPDDEVVVICLTGEDGTPRAVIDSDHQAVREWAGSTFESFRDGGTTLELSLFNG